jgi:hypothetical protein
VGSNSAQRHWCLSSSFVMCCPEEVEVLRWADHPCREPYQLSILFIISKVILNWKRSEGLTRNDDDDDDDH